MALIPTMSFFVPEKRLDVLVTKISFSFFPVRSTCRWVYMQFGQ
jgi:hypothetical protein